MTVILLALPAFDRSAGRLQAAVAGAVLLPPVLAIAILEDRPQALLPTVWSSAVQIDVVLSVAVAVILLASARRSHPLVESTALIRLLFAPFLAIHAAVALPDVLDSKVGTPLLLSIVLISTILAFPSGHVPEAQSEPVLPDDYSRQVLNILFPKLAFLTLYLIVVLVNLEDDRTDGLLGVLWLAIPVSFVLCIRYSEGVPGTRTPRTATTLQTARSDRPPR